MLKLFIRVYVSEHIKTYICIGILIKLNGTLSQLFQNLFMCLTGIMDIESEVFLNTDIFDISNLVYG